MPSALCNWIESRVVRAIELLGRRLSEGQRLSAIDRLSRPLVQDTSSDPYHVNFCHFTEEVKRVEGAAVLAVGSRNQDLRFRFPGCRSYVGIDIHPGPSVDVVGDAHHLTDYFPPNHFDAVFSISVFEHLAMPWKAALEMSRVLKVGGLIFIATHPTWPAHELPWDFWRFSTEALKALLNPRLGFEVLRCADGLPARILSLSSDLSTRALYTQPARLAVSAVARKVAEPDPNLRWDMRIADFLQTAYPLRQAA